MRITRGSPPLPARARVILALAAVGLAGCGEGSASPGPVPPKIAPPAPRPGAPPLVTDAVRVVIDAPGVSGLSDLTTDGTGRLWAIAEGIRVLVRMEADGSAPVVVPLAGVPGDRDVEGVAWLEGDRMALSTESDDPRRTSDLVLFARVDGGGRRVQVERQIALDYALWPLQVRGNQGIEGLCRAGRALVAAVESVVGEGERRLAPVATYDLDRARWTPYLVRLTTTTGKLSALSCRPGPGVIDVLAVERHFEVARLIRFELPAPAPGRPPGPFEVTPVFVADLAPLLERKENFEGLLWDGDRAIALVVDNDWIGVSGPNLLVRARLSGPAPSPRPAGGPPPAARPAGPDPAPARSSPPRGRHRRAR